MQAPRARVCEVAGSSLGGGANVSVYARHGARRVRVCRPVLGDLAQEPPDQPRRLDVSVMLDFDRTTVLAGVLDAVLEQAEMLAEELERDELAGELELDPADLAGNLAAAVQIILERHLDPPR